jgi:hypothetical protein
MTYDTQVVVWLPWAKFNKWSCEPPYTHTPQNTHTHKHTHSHTHTHANTSLATQGRRRNWTMQTELFITKTCFSKANIFHRN